ncbi:hypothetical protein HMPREF9004_0540 [Schaalia cardiffensis F0333]|uniref:Uncharacterized protein n=1 Tax=Schaalia cardiffensis F0333 TaxID=888050 RepID=N6W8I5_9ACTO|nr:hypothetical protein HMPREF9004_0540 [Schaalia cardiffensis F0333]
MAVMLPRIVEDLFVRTVRNEPLSFSERTIRRDLVLIDRDRGCYR